MWNLSFDLIQSAKNQSIQIRQLEKGAINSIRKEILHSFFLSSAYAYPLWGLQGPSISIYDIHGWKRVADFVEKEHVILSFEFRENQDMFEFQTGSDLVHVLSDMHGFVFYLTNAKLDYLLCFNDHNCLIGWGKSANWLNSL